MKVVYFNIMSLEYLKVLKVTMYPKLNYLVAFLIQNPVKNQGWKVSNVPQKFKEKKLHVLKFALQLIHRTLFLIYPPPNLYLPQSSPSQ